MTRHWSRESSLWNRIFYGECRNPTETFFENSKLTEKSEKSEKAQVPEQPKTPRAYNADSDIGEQNQKRSRIFRFIDIALCLIFLSSFFSFGAHNCGEPAIRSYRAPALNPPAIDGEKAQEIIGVAYPFIPKKSYGEPVYSTVLVDHVFDSWNHPDSVTFSPPKTAYNKVVLTLNTSVDGVQYDRLAHIYVGGAEIWRTSTAEPGSKKVFSSYKKDVSSYVSLFQKKTEVLFQLDNIVSGSLTGAFHVNLSADFYLSEGIHQQSGELQNDDTDHELASQSAAKYKYFDIRKPADAVHPLVRKDDHSPPSEHVSSGLTLTLPRVPRNTTRLKLAVFASGNADEEFWYNNVLDRYTDAFSSDGVQLLGHGPLRFVNVWVDGKKVATQTPQPIIFTGGYAPSLWSPVVGTNAFDLPSMDLDVTGLLPLLWEQDTEIRISVDNGVDELEGTSSGIGGDWILSANLLTYECAEVTHASGSVLATESDQDGKAFGIQVPIAKTLQQVAKAQFNTLLVGELVLELQDGQQLNVSAHSIFQADVSNVQSYAKSGEHTDVAHNGVSLKKFVLVDNTENSVVHSTKITLKHPVAFDLRQTLGSESDLTIRLAQEKKTFLEYNGKDVMTEINQQNGTSDFHIRNGGNYGTGSLWTRFQSLVDGAGHQFNYTRKVETEEGRITSDKSHLAPLNN